MVYEVSISILVESAIIHASLLNSYNFIKAASYTRTLYNETFKMIHFYIKLLLLICKQINI